MNILKRTVLSVILSLSIFSAAIPINANSPENPLISNNIQIINPSLLSTDFINSKQVGFRDLFYNLTISGNGVAHFYTLVYATNSKYYCKINMKLQRYKNKKWTTITSGTYGSKSDSMYSRSYYVSKGYKYRLYSKVYIYKSKGGSLITSQTVSSTKTRK